MLYCSWGGGSVDKNTQHRTWGPAFRSSKTFEMGGYSCPSVIPAPESQRQHPQSKLAGLWAPGSAKGPASVYDIVKDTTWFQHLACRQVCPHTCVCTCTQKSTCAQHSLIFSLPVLSPHNLYLVLAFCAFMIMELVFVTCLFLVDTVGRWGEHLCLQSLGVFIKYMRMSGFPPIWKVPS